MRVSSEEIRVNGHDAQLVLTQKVYNRYSSVYDSLWGRVLDHEPALSLLRLFPGAKLLDVGMGTGRSAALLPRDIELTGIDLSEKMLEKAGRKVAELQFEHVKLFRMDAGALAFPDSSFDRVLAAYSLSTVPDPVRVVREMMRVCKPGGLIVFLNHFVYTSPIIRFLEKLSSPVFHYVGFSTTLELSVLLKETGLEVDALEKIDFLGHWKAVRCINPGTGSANR